MGQPTFSGATASSRNVFRNSRFLRTLGRARYRDALRDHDLVGVSARRFTPCRGPGCDLRLRHHDLPSQTTGQWGVAVGRSAAVTPSGTEHLDDHEGGASMLTRPVAGIQTPR